MAVPVANVEKSGCVAAPSEWASRNRSFDVSDLLALNPKHPQTLNPKLEPHASPGLSECERRSPKLTHARFHKQGFLVEAPKCPLMEPYRTLVVRNDAGCSRGWLGGLGGFVGSGSTVPWELEPESACT